MKSKTTHLRVIVTLLTLLIAAGCSKKSSDSSKEAALEDDDVCEEILKSPDIMEASDWISRYPKSLFSSNALDEDDPNGTPLAPVVARLSDAGAQRVVIHYATLGKGKILLGVVVVLPTDPLAREKLFVIGSELCQIEGLREAKDCGQKYLYFSLE